MGGSYKFINENTVVNIGKKYGKFSVTITIPPQWEGKKVIAKLADESPGTEGINPQ